MTPKKAKPWPRTRSKNPVIILKTVIKAITDEPKRYDQNTWGDERPQDFPDRERYFPPCGTVACVAGWVCIVADGKLPRESHIEGMARRLLGLTKAHSDRLFSAFAVTPDRWVATPKSHVRAGVRHIKNFVKDVWGVTL